ncbi:MAG TPA: hypothetical protein VET65_02190 [Candidatus Limnocylindrales bacterium]|nr:hypothetical protein [Candidatus Limnocylindrales bacterium]
MDAEQQVAWIATPYRAPVMDSEGNELGTTESLLGDEQSDIFHGLAVKLKSSGTVVEIPADQVRRITTVRVYTGVTPDAVAALPRYREEAWFHLGWGGLFQKRPEWKQRP